MASTPGQYDNETYLQSLAQSSQDVTRQVANTLAEIARQKGVFQEKASQIPGAVTPIFDNSRASLSHDLGFLGVPMGDAVNQSFTTNQDAYRQAAGLLNQGFDEQAVARQGSVNSIQQSLLADLAAKRASYVSGRESEDSARAFTAQENERQRALQQAISDQQAALQQRLMEAQADEAARSRAFAEQQAALDRQSQSSILAAALRGSGGGGGGAPAPAPRPPAPATMPGQPDRYANGTYVSQRAFDEAYFRAAQAYGPAGQRDFLSHNGAFRPGGLDSGQQAILHNLLSPTRRTTGAS